MGTWGTGLFEDDTACDLIYEAIDTKAKKFIAKAVKLKDQDYLESDDCHMLIIAGVITDTLLNSTNHNCSAEGFDKWVSKQKASSVEKFKSEVIAGLNDVLSDKSELNELWSENEEDYPAWKANVENIINKLST